MEEFTLQGVHYRLAEHPDHPRLVRFLPTTNPTTVAHFGAGYDPADVLAAAKEDRAAMANCPRCGFPLWAYQHSAKVCQERETT